MNKKTATEIMNEEIEITCYLCGKGKVSIRQGDIYLKHPHPLDHEVNYNLKKFLLKKIKEFLESRK